MIKIENRNVFGWEAAIRGMRNPMNSWAKSDSGMNCEGGYWEPFFEIGYNDLDLMKRLCNAGTDHRKYMRMITVYCDIIAPLYWWKEFDTYKVGVVANSCSTMHKIQAEEFTIDDFSNEHLSEESEVVVTTSGGVAMSPYSLLSITCEYLNVYREKYIETKDKKYWWQMIQLLPSSYNQKRTVMLNYEVLANIYKSRRFHKLDEWHTFCDWIEELPYFKKIVLGE